MNTVKLNAVEEAVKTLVNTTGLANVKLLNKSKKKLIWNLEDDFNVGVRECLARKNVVFLTHNSEFRDPEEDIVKEKGETIIMPSIPFKELSHLNAISSSPSATVHRFMKGVLEMNLKDDEASLVIGFD